MRDETQLVPFSASAVPAGPWLVVAPHPDDEVLGVGGAMALAADRGLAVECVVLTGGERGGDPETRRAESRAAGALLGVRHHFWDLPDRGVAAAPFPLERLRAVVDALAPRTVFLPALQEYHPDHRAATRAVFAALRRLGFTGKVWLYEVSRHSETNRLLDVSSVHGRKLAALACFASQRDAAPHVEVAAALARANALTLGPTVTHAEAFFELDPRQPLDTALDAVRAYATRPPPRAGGHPVLGGAPLVSVIVRTRDRPALLAEALASLAAQTHRPLEIVVVNDGGVDVTSVVRAAAVPVRLVEQRPGRGRAAAANRGLEAATGPLVAFLDDDDLYRPGAIAALVAALGDRPAVYGRVVLRHVGEAGPDRHFGAPFDRRVLLLENTIPLNALLFRRAVLDEIGPFREDLPVLEDWELLLRLSDAHEPAFVDEPVAIYRSFGDATAAGGRVSAEELSALTLAIARERWSEVSPEAVRAYAQRLVAERTPRPVFTRAAAPAPAAAPRGDGARLLLLGSEPIRVRQQGNGIRCLEMAAELAAAGHRPLVYAPEVEPRAGGLPFEVRPLDDDDLCRELAGARAVILQGHVSERYFAVLDARRLPSPPLVCDLYDPFLVENLRYVDALGPEIYQRDRAVLLAQLARGDHFLVSSRAQVGFYAGLMLGQGLVGAEAAAGVEQRFLVAPFGVRPPPGARGGRLRAQLGAREGERVVIFGGVYDWYDPELLLDAVAEMTGPVRAVFSANPSRASTPQRAYDALVARAATDPRLAGRVAFVPWFPHAERHAHLGDADVAVCLHRPSLETDLSLRTRVLDWLACGVPVIATDGGETAALLRASGGGVLVPPGDRGALRAALEAVLADDGWRRELASAGRDWVLAHRGWGRTLAPLLDLVAAPRPSSAAPPPPAPRITAPGAAAPSFSVIVPTFDGRRFLPECLSSVLACDYPRDKLELIIVDNGSTDGTQALLRAEFPEARVIWLDHNTGFTGAIAEGARAARGDVLVFLNNDMRVARGWLASYAEAGAECMTGLILDWPGERIDFVGGVLTFDGHALQRHQGAPAGAFRALAPRPTFIACGGNMAVRRELFLRLGGFDPDFFAYIEDVDFSWRLHAAGHEVSFVPGAVAYHHGQGTSERTLGSYRRGLLYETNAFATLYKNVDEAYFDPLLHAALRALMNRTLHVLRESDGPPVYGLRARLREVRARAADLGLKASAGAALRVIGERLEGRSGSPHEHPRAQTQLEAVSRILEGFERLQPKRSAVQALRARPDAQLFRRFPPWVVDTYPGDRELFASPGFRALLPSDIPFRFASVREVHDGHVDLGHHPDA